MRAIRNTRAEKKVELAKKIPATIVAGDKTGWLDRQRAVLITLAKLDEARFRLMELLPEKPKNAIAHVIGATEIYLPLEGLMDLGAERERLAKELAELDKQIQKGETLLGSDFAAKAPAAVVERERAKLAGLRESRQKVEARLKENA